MHDIRWIRENAEEMATGLARRGFSPDEARRQVDDLIAKDEARRAHLASLQEMQERRNYLSKEIGNAMRAKDMVRAEELKAEVAEIKSVIQNGEGREREFDQALADALAGIPNLPLPDVPVGKDEHDNVELRVVGEKPRMNFKPKEHFELGEALGMMDFETAAKLSGSRFTVLKGKLARLERALGQFMLDLHTNEHGYTEVQPPLLVNEAVMYGTGQLPKFEEDLFQIKSETSEFIWELKLLVQQEESNLLLSKTTNAILRVLSDNLLNVNREMLVKILDEAEGEFFVEGSATPTGQELRRQIQSLVDKGELRKYLIPTAEVPLTNLVREQILEQDKLPLRFTALTPCFRSEAGSAGKDTRGMLRQHQFDKVEMVSITDAESSLHEHERMTECAEAVLKRLELPFRTVVLCTGDMGFGAKKTYDIEVWLPGQNTYREISSCSVCGDFQARRMEARYRPSEGKGTRFVHTLNGSGVAVGRALIAVMENYQNADGSVTIPQALRSYMGGAEKID